MANIKTAISLEKSLFEQAESIAGEMKVSRSRLYALALKDFIERHQNEEMLRRINEAYEREADPDEQIRLRKMRRKHRQVLEEQW